jgi:hypothetical protein
MYAKAPVDAVHERVAPVRVMLVVVNPVGARQLVCETSLNGIIRIRDTNKKESNFDFMILLF